MLAGTVFSVLALRALRALRLTGNGPPAACTAAASICLGACIFVDAVKMSTSASCRSFDGATCSARLTAHTVCRQRGEPVAASGPVISARINEKEEKQLRCSCTGRRDQIKLTTTAWHVQNSKKKLAVGCNFTSCAYPAININSCLQALTEDISTPADITPSALETIIF